MPSTSVVPMGLPGNGTVLDWTALKPQLSDTGQQPVVRQNHNTLVAMLRPGQSLMLLFAGVIKTV